MNSSSQVMYLIADREKYRSKEDVVKAIKNKEQIHFRISINQIDSITRYINLNFSNELNSINKGNHNVLHSAFAAYVIRKFISNETAQSLEIIK